MQRRHSAHEHVQVVERGDGGGEVPLGRVQLLDVPRYVPHHGLGLARLGLQYYCWVNSRISISSPIQLQFVWKKRIDSFQEFRLPIVEWI